MSVASAIRRTRHSAGSATLTRAVVGVAGAITLAHLTIPGRPATVCPLRALTGIPCPLCGGTTAMVHLGRLDLIGALRANPVAVIGGVAVITAPVIATIRGRRDHGRFSARTRTLLTGAVIVAVAFSEIWQLIRFGVV